ncbi:MAG: 3-carboxyethylcatechol 2,3-dioxygenase [Lautropia sp.]
MSAQLILCSHSPLILKDMAESKPGAQARFIETMEAVRDELVGFGPDLVLSFGPDHFNGFFYDLMPSFCVGIKAEATRDWGICGGALQVPADLALECCRHLHQNDFDVALSYEMKVDHGTSISLLQLMQTLDRYPVVPIFVNCAADPRPTMRRVRTLGAEVGRFLANRSLRVAIIGSGGLSHDPPTPRLATPSEEVWRRLVRRAVPTSEELQSREARVVKAAKDMVAGGGPCMPPNPEWDADFMRKIATWDVQALDAISDRELDERAGFGGHEVRTWVAASAAAREMAGSREWKTQYRYYEVIPEWLTGMGVVTGSAQ